MNYFRIIAFAKSSNVWKKYNSIPQAQNGTCLILKSQILESRMLDLCRVARG